MNVVKPVVIARSSSVRILEVDIHAVIIPNPRPPIRNPAIRTIAITIFNVDQKVLNRVLIKKEYIPHTQHSRILLPLLHMNLTDRLRSFHYLISISFLMPKNRADY